MPRWPAYVMAAAAAACAYPAVTTPPPVHSAGERYEARGNEPGWHLLIQNGRIEYVGDGGVKKISIDRPAPGASFNGRRYETPRLAVDISYSRCNDDFSGRGYEHQVTILADGEALHGCGGKRRADWDV
jgi:uncharacterized membrane protein